MARRTNFPLIFLTLRISFTRPGVTGWTSFSSGYVYTKYLAYTTNNYGKRMMQQLKRGEKREVELRED